jgi:hypothetical protein
MGRTTKTVLVVIVVAAFLAFFFLAPVVYVFSLHPGVYIPGEEVNYPVYVSLGCKTIGFGTIYSPEYGAALACNPADTNWPFSA